MFILLGSQRYSGVDYSGVIFVNQRADDDYIGIAFSYQSNRKFYVLMWKQNAQTYWSSRPFTAVAKAAIQLKVYVEYLYLLIRHSEDKNVL